MFRNYFKIAWRNLWNNKLFSFINITGLAIGITCCILIFLYIQSELSFDRHWKDADRIVRVNQIYQQENQPDPYALTAFGVAPALKAEYPEVEEALRFDGMGNATIRHNNTSLDIDNIFFTDPNFFKVFNFELLQGDPATCLTEPYTVVISEETAKKFFGNSNPMGQLLTRGGKPAKITGVLKQSEYETRLKPNILISMTTQGTEKMKSMSETWFGIGSTTFIKLRKGTSAADFDRKLREWTDRIFVPALKKEKLTEKVWLQSQPLSENYFDTYYKYDYLEKGEKSYVYIFGWVAVFILLIACFNYMNLSTAKGLKRAKEVGLRKVVGASRNQLIVQFIGESGLVTLAALLLSIILLMLTIPAFNSLTGKTIALSAMLGRTTFWIATVSVILFIAFMGGSYPAFYLSRFQPAIVLKGKLIELKSNSFFGKIKLRQLLVVMQFAISMIIIVSTILIFRQLNYMKTKDLGFNKDQVVILDYPSEDTLVTKNLESIRNDFLSSPSIKGFATGNQAIGAAARLGVFIKGSKGTDQSVLNVSAGDYDYLNLLQIKLLKGRNFSKEFKSDQQAFILNEAAVKFLKLSDPLGSEISFERTKEFGKVVGVVKDFNYRSPHAVIDPLAIVLVDNVHAIGTKIFLKLDGKDLPSSVDLIERKWNQYFPKYPTSYAFFDEIFNRQYGKDHTMLVIFTFFSALTIFISCLGLFGLTAYSTEQRTKEIGIRKVLGASVSAITYLISKDFILLVGISIAIAIPIAYFALSRWLQNFAYHVAIGAGIFLFAGCLAILIAIITVGSQSVKASLTNPTKSLRTE